MRGIVADNDIRGQVQLLIQILQAEPWREFWEDLGLQIESFERLGLHPDSSDGDVWTTCQQREVVLITANRTGKEDDALENVIRQSNTAASLPVLTLALPKRVLRSKAYAQKIAERLLGYLLDMEKHLGAGRLFLS